MADIKNPKLIYFKGFLFLVTGFVSAALLLLLAPSFRVAILFAISVWCFCRFYYFAFYVIQHYVDADFRFSGLIDFIKYVISQRFGRQPDNDRE